MDRMAWRRAWFQLHKWIGLILAILIVPVSLSGAALVWGEGLDRLLHPQRFAVSDAAARDPGVYAAAARRVLPPGARIAAVAVPGGRAPVVVTAAPAGASATRGGPPRRILVYLDPPTARVTGVAASDAGLVRFLHVLHGSLQVPGAGRQIVGWVGVAMMLSCLTGLWLWWPTVGRWTRGLRFRRHRHLDANLHHLFGFWVALPLFVLSLTGAWIAFPGVVAVLTGVAPRTGPDRAARMRAAPLAAPGLALDVAVARARGVAAGPVRRVVWPTRLTPDWTVTFADGATVKVADDSGIAVAAPARDQPASARLMRRIHDGEGMGLPWRVVIFVAGLVPAGLAVTGVIMWWRARGWRARAAGRPPSSSRA